jgi:hypothetical protein
VLEKEIQELEESRNASLAALATLLSTLERVSALEAINPQNQFVQSHFPPPTASSSASNELAGFTTYHSTIPEELNRLRDSLGTACVVVHSAHAQRKRLQNVLNTTVGAIKAKYELIHPIHRLPHLLLTRIFAWVVKEEYAVAAFNADLGREVRPLVSSARLSLVCQNWRLIAYAAESLWNRVLVTRQSPPSPFRPTEVEKSTFVLAVDGSNPLQGDGCSFITRHIQSLASRASIYELTYSGGAFESVLECETVFPHLKRLSLTYTKWKSDLIIITLPGTLAELTYLSCTGTYPSFASTQAALETLEIVVRPKGTEILPLLGGLLTKAPNLRTLSLSGTSNLIVGSDIEHFSLTLIKGSIEPLVNALYEGTLSLPNLSSLELYIFNWWSNFLKWEKAFASGSWVSQIVDLRFVCVMRSPWLVGEDGARKMFAPFSSLRSLSVVHENSPQLLLWAARQALLPKLTHIKVENSACDGIALLNEVKVYNERQEVLNGGVSRLTRVELFNCPNAPAEVMKELRMLKDAEHPVSHPVSHQAQNHEEPTPPSPKPHYPPSALSLVAPEGPLQDLPQMGVYTHAPKDGDSPQAVHVHDEPPALSLSESQPPASPQSETSAAEVKDVVENSRGLVQAPEVSKEICPKDSPLPPEPPLQKLPPERRLTSVRTQQWSGLCL